MSAADAAPKGFRRGCLAPALIVAALLTAALVLLVGYPILRVRIARDRVISYCGKVKTGSPVDLAELARDADREGFRVIGPNPDLSPGDPRPSEPALAPRQTLMIVDGWVFARWVCDIRTDRGVVAATRYSFLD